MRSKFLCWMMGLVLVLASAGCATKSTPKFDAKYYPECYDPIDKLCKDQSNEQEIKGAVAGGIIGAIGGAIVGGLTTGKVEGALVGAGAGAVAGAMTGFFSARLSKIKDQNKRLEEYQKMLGEKSRGWDIERASVEKSYQCYRDQIKLLTKAIKAKRITREEFKARMDEIYNGIKHINTYWADAQTRMDEALADGDAWLKKEDTEAAKNRTQAKVNRQRQSTNSLRVATQKSNARVNDVKSQAQKECEVAMLEHVGVHTEFTYLGEFVAMLD